MVLEHQPTSGILIQQIVLLEVLQFLEQLTLLMFRRLLQRVLPIIIVLQLIPSVVVQRLHLIFHKLLLVQPQLSPKWQLFVLEQRSQHCQQLLLME